LMRNGITSSPTTGIDATSVVDVSCGRTPEVGEKTFWRRYLSLHVYPAI
jgi:hypothetical protein